MKQAVNEIFVEGILLESEIVTGVSKKNGEEKPFIRGEIKIRVDREVDGVMVENIIPIKMFSMKMSKDGALLKSYTEIEKFMTQYVSAAAAPNGIEGADCIRVSIGKNGSYGKITENLYPVTGTDKVRSTYQFECNFFEKINRASLKPMANFSVNVAIKTIKEEIKGDMPTGALILTGAVIQYGDKLDLVEFKVVSEAAKNHISNNYAAGQTVNIQGIINSTSTTSYVEQEAGFGESVNVPKTTTVKELVITSGSIAPFGEERAYAKEDLNKAIDARLARIEEKKKGATAPAPASAPSATTGF